MKKLLIDVAVIVPTLCALAFLIVKDHGKYTDGRSAESFGRLFKRVLRSGTPHRKNAQS